MRGSGRWRATLISLGVGALIALGVLIVNSFWTVSKPDIYRLLSDACIVSAALVGGVGALVFAASRGTFDMLAYGIRHIFDLFRPNARDERYRDFYQYKMAKGERNRPVAHMLIAGLVFFGLSWVFSFIWQQSF